MAAHLPVELVGEIWRAAAELFIENEHRTVLNIAASCTIGYYAATPILYRTLLMRDGGVELIMRVFNTEPITSAPTLSTSPAERLCPLVRRICSFGVPSSFNKDEIQRLTGLETICDTANSLLRTSLAPTLTHFITWTTSWPERLPSTLTHVTLYCYFDTSAQVACEQLKLYMVDTLPNSVTRFALTFCYAFPQDALAELVALIPIILLRKGIAMFCIGLSGAAADEPTYKLLLRAIATLQVGDRNKIRLWRDMRSTSDPKNGFFVAGVRTDLVAGRTLWTEARPVMQEELTAAVIPDA